VPTLESVALPVARPAPRLNRPFIAALLLANFGTNVALIAPIQNILPRMIESAAGSADKALGLGLVTGLGAFAALVFNPLAGHYSDRWVSADNRSVMILIGLVTGGIAHSVIGFQHSLVTIAIWWTLCQATINIAYAPMSAIVVDHVDRKHWGLVWGLVSVAQAVGLIIGLAAVVLVFPSATAGMVAISVSYVLCLIPLVLVLYRLPRVSYAKAGAGPTRADQAGTGPIDAGQIDAGQIDAGQEGADAVDAVPADARSARAGAGGADRQASDAYVADRQATGVAGPAPRAAGTAGPSPAPPLAGPGQPGIRALLSLDQGFGLVWAGRFLIMLAETIALLYLFYYLQDVVHYPDPGDGQLILVLIATVAAIIATVAVGRVADLSDGYRRFAVLASVVMAATGFVLAGFAMWAVVIVCAFALGAGYGAFQSVSQALSLTVLPDPASAGRDLGIINIASAIPQVIGAPVAGLVVANAGGYRGLFVFAGVLAIAAALVFARVRS
jgi:MFS family permease